MRVLLTDLDTTLSAAIARHLQDADHEVLGTVPAKSHLAATKRKLLDHPSSDRTDAIKEPVCVASDKVALTQLLHKADVVIVTRLVHNLKSGMDMLKLFEKAATSSTSGEDQEETEPSSSSTVKRFIALSSVLTWSKNAVLASAKDQRGHKEDDYKTRKPAKKYAELKTCETQILSASRVDSLETCVVACGLLYGGAQSALTPLFRDAWMAPEKDLVVPVLPGHTTKRQGDNIIPMVSVYDVALLTARLAVAPAIPKSYMLAVDTPSGSTTLRDVCVGLSVLLGNGKIRDQLSDDEMDALLLGDEEDGGDDGHRDGATTGSLGALQLNVKFETPSETAAMHELVPLEEYQHVTSGLLSNLAFYVADFIRSMDLRPLKAVVVGPPRVGKTLLSSRLAKEYFLPHLTVQSIVDEVMGTAPHSGGAKSGAGEASSEAKPEEDAEGGNSEARAASPVVDVIVEPEDPQLHQLRVELDAWQRAASELGTAASVGDLPEPIMIALLRWKLTSVVCRNQGYVLDGLPVAATQAAKIFELIGGDSEGGEPADEDADAKGEPADAAADGAKGGESGDEADAKDDADGGSSSLLHNSRSKQILDRLRPKRQIELPNRVILLHAPLELLEQRAQQLSDQEALLSGNTQALFQSRYTQFQSERDPLSTFFETMGPAKAGAADGVEVLELELSTEQDYANSSELLYPLVTKYMNQGGHGKPRNFHPTREELRSMEAEFRQKQQDDVAKQKLHEQQQLDREDAAYHAKMEAEQVRLELLQREEAELLEARAKPLRTYLMDTVLPALTEGMLEIVKVQPDDPIDYLAEFLFQKGREMDQQAGN